MRFKGKPALVLQGFPRIFFLSLSVAAENLWLGNQLYASELVSEARPAEVCPLETLVPASLRSCAHSQARGQQAGQECPWS